MQTNGEKQKSWLKNVWFNAVVNGLSKALTAKMRGFSDNFHLPIICK